MRYRECIINNYNNNNGCVYIVTTCFNTRAGVIMSQTDGTVLEI